MKIFGNPLSTRTRQVLTTLHETETPYEWVMVDFSKGEHAVQRHPGEVSGGDGLVEPRQRAPILAQGL